MGDSSGNHHPPPHPWTASPPLAQDPSRPAGKAYVVWSRSVAMNWQFKLTGHLLCHNCKRTLERECYKLSSPPFQDAVEVRKFEQELANSRYNKVCTGSCLYGWYKPLPLPLSLTHYKKRCGWERNVLWLWYAKWLFKSMVFLKNSHDLSSIPLQYILVLGMHACNIKQIPAWFLFHVGLPEQVAYFMQCYIESLLHYIHIKCTAA